MFRPTGARNAATLALVAGNRNMALVLGAAPAAFEPDGFLFLAMLQFPIYLLPALLGRSIGAPAPSRAPGAAVARVGAIAEIRDNGLRRRRARWPMNGSAYNPNWGRFQ